MGDDDLDDFVAVPPKPPAAESSKANTVVARKIKKYKSSVVGPKQSEGVQNPNKRKNPNYRSAPNKVVEAIHFLTNPQKVKIRDYPFGPLLDLKLKGLENTKLLVFLMDCLDPDTLTLDIGIGKPLKITRHSIQCVLGLPNRGKRIIPLDRHQQKAALSNLKQKLGIEPGVDVKVQDLINWLKKEETDPFSTRCFIIILLAKLLVPGTSDFITGNETSLTEDMATLSLVNWASVIFDDITIAAKLWRSKKKSCTNPSMHRCLMFLLVYYLDNLLVEHSTSPVLTPRIAHITKKQLLDLIEGDKQVVNGVETFGALPLRSQEGTCYMEGTHSSSYDPSPTESADIPSASHPFPSSFFPSLHHHLAGCFNCFHVEKQLAAKEALRRCDEEVGNLTLQISTAQMMAIQEVKSILCDGQTHTNSPQPPPDDPQRQPISSHVAEDPNVLVHEGRNNVADANVTDSSSYIQVTQVDGFNNLSSSHQDISQSPYNSPLESLYDSPHEVLTNGVCKTCHEEDEMCLFDEELPNEEVDADPSAADEADLKKQNEPSALRPIVDGDSPRHMASPTTPHVFRPMRNIIPDPSLQGLHSEPAASS